MSFVSRRDFRPPKLPPNMHEFRLWRDFRQPKVPPKVAEFRLWRGLSAAEPAAENALSSLLLPIFLDSFRMYEGGFGEFHRVVLKLVWSLI